MTEFPCRVVTQRTAEPSAVHDHYYQTAIEDPEVAQIWCYTTQLSYRPGDDLDIHVSTTASAYTLTILRDGAEPRMVFEQSGLDGAFHPAPRRCYMKGCGWPTAIELPIPLDWPSGAYVVKVADQRDDRIYRPHHPKRARPVERCLNPAHNQASCFDPSRPCNPNHALSRTLTAVGFAVRGDCTLKNIMVEQVTTQRLPMPPPHAIPSHGRL